MCLKPRNAMPDEVDDTDLVVEILDDISAAFVNSRIYELDHPRVQNTLGSITGFLREMSTTAENNALRLSIVDGLVIRNDRPLLGASMTSSRLIKALEAFSSGGLDIDLDATTEDLSALLTQLAARPAPGVDWNQVNEVLATAGHQRARLLGPFVEGRDGRLQGAGDLRAPVRLYQSCVDLLQDVTVSICHGGHIQFGPVEEHAEAVLRGLEGRGTPLMSLAAFDQYDAFTFGHSIRVTVLALSFARTMTDDRELLNRIGSAALLHDCGKALVPFEILHSRGVLSDDEKREMDKHAQFGSEILIDHDEADPIAVATAFGHHRSCNGGGYPQTACEHRNLLITEIVKICDVYEALTAARPYKQAMSPTRAHRVMVSMGDHFDRRLLRRFIYATGVYPAGQLVALSSGECARVIAQTGTLVAPRVSILTDAEGQALPEAERPVVDLSDPAAALGRTILEVVKDHDLVAVD